MVKHLCDRCGKEIQVHALIKLFNDEEHVCDYELTRELSYYGIVKMKWELCHDCSEKLKKFMRGEDVRDEN